MDFITLLPVEISQMIFRKLRVEELYNCMMISKNWRKLANVNYLWKNHCLSCGLDPNQENTFKRNCSSDLCQCAQVWLNFRTSSAFGWRSKQWKTQERETTMDEHHASDKESLIFCKESMLKVHNMKKMNEVKYSGQLPFLIDNSCCLEIDSSYVAVAKYNIIIIYKMMQNDFMQYMTLAINGEILLKSYTLIDGFIKKNLKKKNYSVEIISFLYGKLLFRKNTNFKCFLLNIITGEIIIFDLYSNIVVTGTSIVSWRIGNLKVDNLEGYNILHQRRDISRVTANNHVVVTLSYVQIREGHYSKKMESWEASTGKRFFSKLVPNSVGDFIVHPSKNILYQLHNYNGYLISCCPIKDQLFWSMEVPVTISLFNMGLQVVCDRFLVIFDMSIANEEGIPLYVFDVLGGQYLYKTDRPPGYFTHLSDNFLITRSADKIYLRTFN